MDEHVHWLRATIIDTVASRLIVAGLTACAGTFLLMAIGGVDVVAAVPWAILVGQVTVAPLFLLTAAHSPINPRYLAETIYLEHAAEFSIVDYDEPPHSPLPVGDTEVDDPLWEDAVRAETRLELSTAGWNPVASIESFGVGRTHDVYQATPGFALAVVGRRSGDPCFVAQLSDGRFLVTSELLVLPHSKLIVDFHPGHSSDELMFTHVNRIEEMELGGRRVVEISPYAAVRVLAYEQMAWQQLGSRLGAFLRLDGHLSLGFRTSLSNAKLRSLWPDLAAEHTDDLTAVALAR